MAQSELKLIADRGDASFDADFIRITAWRTGAPDRSHDGAGRFDGNAAADRHDARRLSDARRCCASLGMSTRNWRLAFTLSQGRRLVKLGNLDALTALLLLWLETRRHDRFEDMRQLASLLYQLMLMLGMEFDRRDMAEELFLMFRAEVFERTDWEDGRFVMDETINVRGVHLLYCLLYKIKDVNPFSSWFARCQAMQALLNGKKGLDVQFGLQILLVPDWRDGPPTRKRWWLWRQPNLHWLWGWMHLNCDTSGRAPDDALWDEWEAKFETLDWTKNLLPAWTTR